MKEIICQIVGGCFNINQAKKNILPHIKKLTDSTLNQFKKGQAHIKNKILPSIKSKIKPLLNPARGTTENENFVIKNQSIKNHLSVRHYTQLSENSKILPMIEKMKTGGQKFSLSLSQGLSWLLNPKTRSILY